jgi:hypothetical protein
LAAAYETDFVSDQRYSAVDGDRLAAFEGRAPAGQRTAEK